MRGGVGAMDDGPRGVRVGGVVQGQVLGGHDGGHWGGVSVGSGLRGGGGSQAGAALSVQAGGDVAWSGSPGFNVGHTPIPRVLPLQFNGRTLMGEQWWVPGPGPTGWVPCWWNSSWPRAGGGCWQQF